MALEKKHALPAAIAGGCLILIGAWKLNQGPSEADLPTAAVAASGAQSVGFNQGDTRATASAPTASTASSTSTTGQLPVAQVNSGHQAAGTLNDQVERALAAKDGLMAAKLADTLKECDISQRMLEIESSRGSRPDADPAVQAVRMERLQEYQRLQASCQTVPGDQKQVRMRLLDLAIQQGVIGAATEAFLAGSREPATMSQVVRDANAGDVNAMTNVALYETTLLGITRDQQDAVRYALKLVSTDPDVGTRAATFLRVAESYAAPNSSFDFSGISSAARASGAEIAERLKQRLGKKAP